MLTPNWFRPAWRQLLLGGVSRSSAYLHQIMLLGLFQPRPGEYARPRGDERVFSGDTGYFRPILPHSREILREFRAMTRPRWIALADQYDCPIAVTIRRGKDFKDAKHSDEFWTKGGLRTPLEWFRSTIILVRGVLGQSAPVAVVSDGTEADLWPVLSLGDIRLVRPGSAASDLLVLSKAKVLIGSGGSSFSAWGSYFSGAPTAVIPGQSLTWFGLEPANQFELDPAQPDDTFLQRVKDAKANV